MECRAWKGSIYTGIIWMCELVMKCGNERFTYCISYTCSRHTWGGTWQSAIVVYLICIFCIGSTPSHYIIGRQSFHCSGLTLIILCLLDIMSKIGHYVFSGQSLVAISWKKFVISVNPLLHSKKKSTSATTNWKITIVINIFFVSSILTFLWPVKQLSLLWGWMILMYGYDCCQEL